MKKNHWFWMIIGCGLPLLLIFLAPAFGVGNGSPLFIFILFMFACHLFMPHGSERQVGHNQNESKNRKVTSIVEPKNEIKGQHQH